MSGEDNPRTRLEGILEGLAESIAHEDGEELLREAQAAGQDPKAIVENFRRAAESVLKKLDQKKLEAAREAYRLHSTNELKKKVNIAPTPQGRKRQLSAILERNPEIRAALTTQYREFAGSSDDDIESALEDLAELGFLDDSPETRNVK
jgi:hypothetical protein